MISVLKQAKHKFRAIVPHRAKSCGTLLCLAADCILMGPTSELGPIDPFVEDDVPARSVAWAATIRGEPAGDDFNILRFHANQAIDQTKSMAKQALSHGLMKDAAAGTMIDDAVAALSEGSAFPSHGSVIDAASAKKLGFNVEYVNRDNEIWSRVWLLYCMLHHDTRLRNIVKIFESRNVSLSIKDGNNE